jgi:hypothetical protein
MDVWMFCQCICLARWLYFFVNHDLGTTWTFGKPLRLRGLTKPRPEYLRVTMLIFGNFFEKFSGDFLPKSDTLTRIPKRGHSMADDYLDYLKADENRVEVALRLIDYARKLLLVHYSWEAGDKLPGGKDPEDIVLEAFSRVSSGKRKLNNRFSYEVQLKGIVRSLISGLFKLVDARLEDIDAEDEDGGREQVPGIVGGIHSENKFESQEYSKRFFDLLEKHPKVSEDEDFGLVILAYVDGCETAGEVARETGIPIGRVYEYNRKLATILRKVQAQMKI